MDERISRYGANVAILLLSFVAAFVVAVLPSSADAASGDSALTSAPLIVPGSDFGGSDYRFGSTDGYGFDAKVVVYGVTGGSLNFAPDPAKENSYTLALDNVSAYKVVFNSAKAGLSFNEISIDYTGNNRITGGITSLSDVGAKFAISGDDDASLALDGEGISIRGANNTVNAPEFVIGAGNVYIDSAEWGISAPYMDVKILSDSMTITNVPKGGCGISTQHAPGKLNQNGGRVSIWNGCRFTCVVGDPKNDYAIYAESLSNAPESFVQVVGKFPIGTRFKAKGKTYTLVYANGDDCALPADGSAMPREVSFAGNTYPNYYSSSPVPGIADGKTATVNGGTYKVTSNAKSTAVLHKAPKSKTSFMVPSYAAINGLTYKVVGISANAFKGAKTKTVTVKTTNLTRSSTKKCFVGAKKLKTVVVKIGNASVNKKYVKKYKKVFVKSSCGANVTVK